MSAAENSAARLAGGEPSIPPACVVLLDSDHDPRLVSAVEAALCPELHLHLLRSIGAIPARAGHGPDVVIAALPADAGGDERFVNCIPGSIAVIAVLPEADDARAVRLLHAGVQDVLVSDSFDQPRLRQSVNYAIARHRAVRRSASTAAQVLADQAAHDALTGLANRAQLNSDLAAALGSLTGTRALVAVALLDIDHFKRVNDAVGHNFGDDLLRAVAGRLKNRIRTGDTVARFYGDEFVVVWPRLRHAAEAVSLGNRLEAAFAEPFAVGGRVVQLRASMGLAVGGSEHTGEELLRAADAARHDAKQHARGRMRVFTPALSLPDDSELETEFGLRQALAHDQLTLHYQPIIDLPSSEVTMVEALLRWNHPSGGLLPPADFIPLAERTGLIVPVGNWAIQHACEQLARWSRQHPRLRMAVNLSARQLSAPELVPMIANSLAETGVPGGQLVLEVTESVVVEDLEVAKTTLNRIADLGCLLAIDDFGTGYSSLSNLKSFPFRIVKIDRSFVAGVVHSPEDSAIVASVLSLAQAFEADCIAEGVETVEQLRWLVDLGVSQAQGYLFSPPVPAGQVSAALAACRRTADAIVPVPAQRQSASIGQTARR